MCSLYRGITVRIHYEASFCVVSAQTNSVNIYRNVGHFLFTLQTTVPPSGGCIYYHKTNASSPNDLFNYTVECRIYFPSLLFSCLFHVFVHKMIHSRSILSAHGIKLPFCLLSGTNLSICCYDVLATTHIIAHLISISEAFLTYDFGCDVYIGTQ